MSSSPSTPHVDAREASASCSSYGPRPSRSSADSGGEGLAGEVLSQTFLGATTRLHVAAAGTEWTADLSAERAGGLPVGARVSISFPPASARLLTLGESEEALPAPDPDDQ